MEGFLNRFGDARSNCAWESGDCIKGSNHVNGWLENSQHPTILTQGDRLDRLTGQTALINHRQTPQSAFTRLEFDMADPQIDPRLSGDPVSATSK